MEDEKPEREQSLAEFLGLVDPAKPLEDQNPVPPGPMTAKELSKGVLQSGTYRESLMRRILTDTLPPAVEVRLMDYAYGKPVERMEVRELPADYSDLTEEQLRERLRLAAERLQEDTPETVDAEVVEPLRLAADTNDTKAVH